MATDTFLKNPVLIVGTKQEVSAATIQENDLVAVTDERFYTAEEVDDIVSSTEQDIRSAISESEQSIRNDMNASDSGLQTQITANAGEITTIKNDLGDLGDQVSTIESKIPNETTDSNQLVNKQELTDTAADIRGDFDQADSELQSQITAQAARIEEIDSEKLDNNLGSENAGKVLTVDSNGNVIAESTTETGALVTVAHDTSLKGSGKDSDPLGVADSVLEDISTTKNDLGDLGDQVSGIEAKIPEDASEQNQLATKNQITGLQNSKQDVATAVNYDNITNCITEIPQDIKLELNNGTLTLNAGSKAYVPNGAGVFDVRNINSDTVLSTPTGTNQWLCAISATGTILTRPLSNCVSGAGATATTGFAYDTTANNIGFYNTSGVLQYSNISLPICIITTTDSVITSIDQVFNGFGYIGSTAFALPGVRALAPNGRNADGTLKNRTITISAVSTTTDVSGATGGLWYTIDNNNITRVNLGVFTFSEDLNYFVNSNGQSFGFVIVDENSYRTNGRITSFNPKQAFRAVDYSDFESTVEEINSSILSTKTELNSSISSTKTELNSSISAVDSNAVHKTGIETIQGTKTFLNNTLWKYDVIEVGVTPETNKYATWNSVYDKNNKMISFIETAYLTDGTLSLGIGERTYINDSAVTNSLTFRTDANGNRTAVLSYNPLASSNDKSIATTQWTKTLFLPLAGGTVSGAITTKNSIFFETAGSTGYRGFLYKPYEGTFSIGISKSDGSDRQSFQSFMGGGHYQLYVGDDTKTKVLDARSDGTLTWDGYPIIRMIEYRSQTTSGNYTWYRKYSDGWVEQGGAQDIGNNNRTVTFPIAMAEKDAYDLQLTVVDRYRYACVGSAANRTTTSIVVTTGDDSSSNNDGTINWYVCGYAAQ